MGSDSPFETLHSYVHNSFVPFFRSFAKAQEDSQAQKGEEAAGCTEATILTTNVCSASTVAAVTQKMVELELSLYNCTQDVQIEDVSLPINPEIRAAAKVCTSNVVFPFEAKTYAQGREGTLKVDDLGPIANDTDFLNTLQSGVNVWIKNIQKVTKLDR